MRSSAEKPSTHITGTGHLNRFVESLGTSKDADASKGLKSREIEAKIFAITRDENAE